MKAFTAKGEGLPAAGSPERAGLGRGSKLKHWSPWWSKSGGNGVTMERFKVDFVWVERLLESCQAQSRDVSFFENKEKQRKGKNGRSTVKVWRKTEVRFPKSLGSQSLSMGPSVSKAYEATY